MTQKEKRSSDEIIVQPDSGSPIQEDKAQPTRSGCAWGIAGAIGCLVLILVVPVTLVLLGVTSFSSLLGGLGGALGVGQPPRASVISTQTIIEGILPLGQLVTVSAQLATVSIRVNVNQGTFNACGYGASHAAQGTMEAGVDLLQIRADDLTYDSSRQTYLLSIPAPQLTSCRIDNIGQYDKSFTTCTTANWDEARQLAQYMALTQFRDDALEGGILRRAESETRIVLGNFVRLLTGHPVEIVFQQPETAILPASCQPDPPQGWNYDPGSNLWSK